MITKGIRERHIILIESSPALEGSTPAADQILLSLFSVGGWDLVEPVVQLQVSFLSEEVANSFQNGGDALFHLRLRAFRGDAGDQCPDWNLLWILQQNEAGQSNGVPAGQQINEDHTSGHLFNGNVRESEILFNC